MWRTTIKDGRGWVLKDDADAVRKAWQELVADLESAAEILRNGTLDDLANCVAHWSAFQAAKAEQNSPDA